MSASQAAAAATDQGEGAPPGDDVDIETRARLMGWKPEAEYRGPDGGWLPAEEFVAKADRDGRISKERYAVLERRFVTMERNLQGKLDEATGVITHMSDQMRRTDERAYKRAKAELELERDRAIEAGDKAAVRAVDREIADLDKDAPKPPARTETTPAPQPNSQAPNPEAVAWAQRNPWFMTNPALNAAAQRMHVELQATNPELTTAENLERVQHGMAALYPDIVKAPRRGAPPPEPDDEPVAENPRRNAPGDVSPSSGSRGGAKQNPRGFDAIPKDSRDAFARYEKSLALKPGSKPLTKAEWAETYWAQFD